MDEIGRRYLYHDVPRSIDPSREVFSLTICSAQRDGAPLIPLAAGLIEAIRFYHDRGDWWVHVTTVMPDHVHILAGFHAGAGMADMVQKWKAWTARRLGADWQSGFFDHRLRGEESLRRKGGLYSAESGAGGVGCRLVGLAACVDCGRVEME